MASAATLAILLLLLLPLAKLAQAQRSITSGSLTAGDQNAFWRSPSGDFAFGFQEIGRDGFLLAIWFDKIPEKTVIWSANGANLSREGSSVEMIQGGGFVLKDPNGQEAWAPRRTGVSHASMLDNGNFVLVDETGSNLWESFKNPTDTIVPTQELDRNTKLVSRYSDTNYSTGRFEFDMQFDGNLVMLTHLPVFDVSNAYWSTRTIDSGHQVIFDRSGQIYVTGTDGSVISPVMSDTVWGNNFFQRAIIEYDGVFRQYVYPRNASLRSGRPMAWSMISSPVPENICLEMRQTVSGGACGYNSYCTLEGDQKPRCRCPYGFSFLDPSNDMNGCKRDFPPQSCKEGMLETELFTVRRMVNTDWPLSDYEHYNNQNEDLCSQACLNDCFCDVAIFRNGECWKKRMPLSNGRVGSSVGGVALIKMRIDNSTSKDPVNNWTLSIIGSTALNPILLLLTFLFWFQYNRAQLSRTLQPYPMNGFTGMRSFTYKELQEATGGFKEELGKGAFGAIYKGVLPSSERRVVAVRVLEKMTSDDEREFKTEVDTIGRANHKNLVEFIGFCNEGQHRLLVYEFVPNGSLADFLFGGPRLRWSERTQIACGVARGLLYLHEECSKQIIHYNIKPQNILLDESLTAKISDFGLAKLVIGNQTRTVTPIPRSKEYFSPECIIGMPVSVKFDVYNFGILLLELISCKKSCEFELGDGPGNTLSYRVHHWYHKRMLDKIVEDDEEALGDKKRLLEFVKTALSCIQDEPSLRPPMKIVAQMLDRTAEVSILPDAISLQSD